MTMMTKINKKITRMTIDKLFIGISSQAMKLDVEYKEDKISSLGREVADLENRGADQEEVDIKQTNISKHPKPFCQIAGPKNMSSKCPICHLTVIQFSSSKCQFKTRFFKSKLF